MQQIKPSDSRPPLSRLVYGTWRLVDDEDQSIKHVRAKIDTALAEGLTTFDHADIYGNYECEKHFGKALAEDKSLRDQMQIVTKCDIALKSDKHPSRRVKYYDTSEEYIRMSVENSLQHLHTDYLDSLLIHRPDPLMNAAETGAILDSLIDSGKILSAGVSNFRPDDWRLLQKHMKHKLAVNQIEISLLHQEPFTNGDINAMQLDDMAVMAWSPLASGRLFSDEAAARRVRPHLQKIADNHNTRLDVAAFAWLLQHPAKIMPVVGTNSIERIQGVSAALNISIDRETWFEIWTAAAGQDVP